MMMEWWDASCVFIWGGKEGVCPIQPYTWFTLMVDGGGNNNDDHDDDDDQEQVFFPSSYSTMTLTKCKKKVNSCWI